MLYTAWTSKPSLGDSPIIFPILDFWIFFVKNDSIYISE